MCVSGAIEQKVNTYATEHVLAYNYSRDYP